MTSGGIVALCGGIGGAKLVLGLSRTVPPGSLTVVVNTGDDFEHLGLSISPDLDTVMYTLADLDNLKTGWGRRDETWNFMRVLESLGGESWFRLGDADLALHVERTRRLHQGESLSEVTADVALRWGVASRIVPMSDDPVRTVVVGDEGRLSFQQYFVARGCAPTVAAIEFQGASLARPHAGALEAISSDSTEAIIICPSNPYLSIDPIFAMDGLKSAVATSTAPVIAVTPIIGKRAIKGPTVKIMAELNLAVSPTTVARHYHGLIDGYILDQTDVALEGEFELPVCVLDTLMHTVEDKVKLAEGVCAFARQLRSHRRQKNKAS